MDRTTYHKMGDNIVLIALTIGISGMCYLGAIALHKESNLWFCTAFMLVLWGIYLLSRTHTWATPIMMPRTAGARK